MSWADLAKKNTSQIKKPQTPKITKETYLKSYYEKMPIIPNSLPILELIYFFRLICKNYNICFGLSYDLSRLIFAFFQPSVKIFSDYSEKIIYKNTPLYTPFGVMLVDKVACASKYKYGYDIVSTFGLSEKIFGNYFRNKYFYINYLSDDGINIEFYEHLNSYWINSLELMSPIKWGIRLNDSGRQDRTSDRFKMLVHKNCNFSRIANESPNFETFLEKLKNVETMLGFKLNEYAMSPKHNYRKLRQIYYIYKKINLLADKTKFIKSYEL